MISVALANERKVKTMINEMNVDVVRGSSRARVAARHCQEDDFTNIKFEFSPAQSRPCELWGNDQKCAGGVDELRRLALSMHGDDELLCFIECLDSLS